MQSTHGRARRVGRPTNVQSTDDLRRATLELYGLLGALGERLFYEAFCLCDDEREAAAWASASLVRSLEERRLLERIAFAP
jgi:hypothetical protein